MFTTADESKCAHVVKVSGNEEQALQCRLNLGHPCPDDPEWGYGGGGQLAVSLMADALGSNRAGDQLALCFYQDFKCKVVSNFSPLPWKMTRERVLLEIRDLILDDLKNCGASGVAQARDYVAWRDVEALLNKAEQRGEDLGDFHKREAEQIRKKVDEEFRIILEQTLGMSPAVCDQLLKPKVDRSQA